MECLAGRSADTKGRASPVISIAKGLRGLAAYMSSLMGADAYRKYLEHFTSTGHSGPAMTEREFWRDRMDRQDSNPQGRCC
ncbi:YbdD/YjiX family protein [Paenarthrobacter sp. 2TAF44]|uniref:YbdD/YjiX family protein n=1 Tax=Paenarthrobacter sp. 2TAF44 TaxID=3233018 RepID=UPI003F9B7939